MNNISIVGRITRDLELATTTSGIKTLKFNVAVKSEFKAADGSKLTDFFTCVAWRETAETISKYFKKGQAIGIIGTMNSRAYEYKGENRLVWELNVKSFDFVSSNEENAEKKPNKAKNEDLIPIEDDDCPF